MTTPQQTFITHSQLEVAACELIGAGLPVTQEGAEKFASRVWRGNARARKQRQLSACYRPRFVRL